MKILFLTLALSTAVFSQIPRGTPSTYSENTDQKIIPHTKLPGPDKAGIYVPIVADSFDDISALIAKGDLAKSEFETKNEYLQRVVKWAFTTSNPKTKKLLSETVFVFSDEIARYDAERRRFTLHVPDLLTQMGRAIGQIDSGRPQIIQLSRWESYGGWSEIRTQLPELSFEAMPQVAKVIKPQLAIAVFGIPVKMSGSYTLELLPLRMAVFNKETHEVYVVKDMPDYIAGDR